MGPYWRKEAICIDQMRFQIGRKWEILLESIQFLKRIISGLMDAIDIMPLSTKVLALQTMGMASQF